MHERDEPKTPRLSLDLIGHGAECESVDEHKGTIRYRRQLTCNVVESSERGLGKTVLQLPDIDIPAARMQSRNHTTVVFVASCRCLKGPGCHQDNGGSAHGVSPNLERPRTLTLHILVKYVRSVRNCRESSLRAHRGYRLRGHRATRSERALAIVSTTASRSHQNVISWRP